MLKSNQQTQQDNRLEATGFLTFDEAIDGAIQALADKNIQGVRGEPDIFIIVRHNGDINGAGDKLIDVIAHIGAPKQDILNDVNQMLP